MAITLTCPECGALYEDLDDSMLGTEVQCHCSHVFIAEPDRPKGQPNVVKVAPQSKPAAPKQPAQPNFQPASSAAAGMGSAQKKPASRPISQKPRRNAGVKIVSLVVFAVLGGASAFGVLNLTGVLDNGQPEPDSNIAVNDPPQPDESGNSNPDINQPDEHGNGAPGNTVTPTPIDDNNPLIADNDGPNDNPLDPIVQENPDEPGDGNPDAVFEVPVVVAGERPYTLLEVDPFDRSVPSTGALYHSVQAGISELQKARKTLATTLDELVITLATEGELDAIEAVRQTRQQIELSGDISGLNNLENESVVAARDAYVTAVDTVKTDLRTAYDTAIEGTEDEGTSFSWRRNWRQASNFQTPSGRSCSIRVSRHTGLAV